MAGDIDWSRLPEPQDDGGADHLVGKHLADVVLRATDGTDLVLSSLAGVMVLYAFPMTAEPGTALPADWDMIPGARGCTPQSCAFRDHFAELRENGVDRVFGVSTQTTPVQVEAVERLNLPFPLLSDHEHWLADAMHLPTMEVEGRRLLRRLSLIARDGVVLKVNYPVFPPDEDAEKVLAWVRANIAAE